MAVKYIDTGGDGYTNYVRRGWLGNASAVTQGTDGAGRKYGIIAANGTGQEGVYEEFASPAAEYYIGMTCWTPSPNSAAWAIPIFGFCDGSGNNLIQVICDNSYHLHIWNYSGSSAGSYTYSSAAMFAAAFYELHVYDVSGGTCSAQLRVNATAVLTVTGVNINSATDFGGFFVGLNQSFVGDDSTAECDWQNLYVFDALGSHNNTYNGVSVVENLSPDAPGHITQWTPSTGTNWSAVSTSNPTGAPNVSSATVGNRDTYALQSLPPGLLAIQAFQVTLDAEYVNGAIEVAPIVSNGSTDNVGTSISPVATFANYSQIYDENPLTSAAWALADFNTLQIGIKQTA